jgi:hypothetical protein
MSSNFVATEIRIILEPGCLGPISEFLQNVRMEIPLRAT